MKWDEMSPRERDALVAERVMGWKWVHATSDGMGWCDEEGSYTGYGEGGSSMAGAYSRPFNPTTDISAAWQVVEKMLGDGRPLALEVLHKGWEARMHLGGFDSIYEMGTAPTAPEAICLAALRAKGVEV